VFSTLFFYSIFGFPEKCLTFAKKTAAIHQYDFSKEDMSRLLICYEKASLEVRKNYEHFFTEQTHSIKLNTSSSVTADNYLYLYNVLYKKNIELVIVGYPNSKIDIYRAHFSKAGIESDIFVSNEKNFAPSQSSIEYEKYFIDRFAPTFGHGTTFGNSLIAEEVAKFLKLNFLK
ncbi:MAG: hypothetical protein ABL930_09615, partial [Pseudobdellovibrio sp.]